MFVKVFILFVIFYSPSLSFAETVITTQFGGEYRGRIVEKTDKMITLKSSGGKYYLPVDDIETIDGNPFDPHAKAIDPQPAAQAPSPLQPLTAQQIFEKTADTAVVIFARSGESQSQGSGFIATSDGIIVTNFHVVSGADAIEVKTRDGRRFPVTDIIAYKQWRDVCILKIDAKNLPVAKLGNSNDLKTGQPIYVVGAPLGMDYSITNGIYSAPRELIGKINLQISAPISPGNSGGPVFDEKGSVIGVATFTLTQGQNMNFAVPINDIRPMIHSNSGKTMAMFALENKQSSKYFSQGLEDYSKGDVNSAVQNFENALNEDPTMIDALVVLAEVYSEVNRGQDAVVMGRKAVSLDGKDPEAYKCLGAALALVDQWQEAAEAFQKATELKPDDQMAYNNLSSAYEHLGRLDEALEASMKAAHIPPLRATHYSNLGWIFHRLKRDEEAISALEKAINIDPSYSQSYNNLATIYLEKGDMDLAKATAQKLIDRGGGLATEVALKLGIVQTEASLEMDNKDWVQLSEEGEKYFQNDDPEKGFQFYKKALMLCSGNEKEKFLVLFQTLRIASHLTAIKMKRIWGNNYTDDDVKSVQELSREHINIVENHGGIKNIISLDKKYLGIFGFKPLLNGNTESIYTAGYFNLGLLSGLIGDSETSIRCYNAIKDYSPKNAKLIMEMLPHGQKTGF